MRWEVNSRSSILEKVRRNRLQSPGGGVGLSWKQGLLTHFNRRQVRACVDRHRTEGLSAHGEMKLFSQTPRHHGHLCMGAFSQLKFNLPKGNASLPFPAQSFLFLQKASLLSQSPKLQPLEF